MFSDVCSMNIFLNLLLFPCSMNFLDCFFFSPPQISSPANKAIHGDGSITSAVSVCRLSTIDAISACHSLCSAPYCLTSLWLAAQRTTTHAHPTMCQCGHYPPLVMLHLPCPSCSPYLYSLCFLSTYFYSSPIILPRAQLGWVQNMYITPHSSATWSSRLCVKVL